MASRSIRGNPRLAMAAVGLAAFMTSLDNTVVNVALPSIQRDLGLSLGGLEWVASAYVLVFASLLLAGGRLADLYGRKRMFLAGTAVFTAASLVSGLARGEGVLLAGRVAQGAGAALAAPTALAIISAMFPGERERSRAVGAWSGVTALAVALAVALGPLAGGFISQHWQWGWIFFINVPLGLLTLALGAAAISESRGHGVSRSVDLPGLGSATLALAALAYALIQGHQAGWTSPAILACFSAATAAGGVFAVVESRSAAPMVDLALFRSRVLSGGTATLVLWGFGVLGVYFFTPLYLQVVLGFSPTRAGLAFVPMALLMAASATLAPLVSGRAGGHRPARPARQLRRPHGAAGRGWHRLRADHAHHRGHPGCPPAGTGRGGRRNPQRRPGGLRAARRHSHRRHPHRPPGRRGGPGAGRRHHSPPHPQRPRAGR